MSEPKLPVVLGPDGQPLARSRGTRAERLVAPPPYRGASQLAANVGDWRPSARSADGEVAFDRDALVERCLDLYRNAGMARGAVRKSVDAVVGAGWTLVPTPDAEALGVSTKLARMLGRLIAREFRAWAFDPRRFCDVERVHDFNGLLRLLYHSRKQVGETLAILKTQDHPAARYRTAVLVVDPRRLRNAQNTMDSDTLRGGVHLDADTGEPLAYDIQNGFPFDPIASPRSFTWETAPRETAWGRPVVVHGFDRDRPGQTRGLPPLAPVLVQFKMLARYSEAELNRASIHALMVAFVESGFDPGTVAESFADAAEDDLREGWHDIRSSIYAASPVKLGGDTVPVLPPGDKVTLNTAQTSSTPPGDFTKLFLREVAACFGVPYNLLAEDYEGVNYSSLRGELNEYWRTVNTERHDFLQDTVAPIYLAFLDEAFDRGFLVEPPGAPAFWDAPHAYVAAQWIGPGRGWVDPVKEVQAAILRIEAGLSTPEREAAEQGLSIAAVYEALARQAEERARHGLGPADVRTLLQPLTPAAE